MNLTSSEITSNLGEQQSETKRIEGLEVKLKGEANQMSAALSQMKETGEYDEIKSALENGLRNEVRKTRDEEISKKLNDVNKQLESNATDNQGTLSDLNNNLNQVGSIKSAEVAQGANEIVGQAKQSLSQAVGERTELGNKLSKAMQDVAEISSDADKIDI